MLGKQCCCVAGAPHAVMRLRTAFHALDIVAAARLLATTTATDVGTGASFISDCPCSTLSRSCSRGSRQHATSPMAFAGLCISASAFIAPTTSIATRRWSPWHSPRLAYSRQAIGVGIRPASLMAERGGLPWSRATLNEAFDAFHNAPTPTESGSGEREEPRGDAWASNGWDDGRDGLPSGGHGLPEEEEDARRAPSAGASGGIGMGSPEFVNLVKAQFDVLAAMLGVSQIVLFVRRENTETGDIVLLLLLLL